MKKKKKKIPTISRFGSHQEMVIGNASLCTWLQGPYCPINLLKQFSVLSIIELQRGQVLCQDEHGEYLTEECRLDDKLADPNRCDWEYRGIDS